MTVQKGTGWIRNPDNSRLGSLCLPKFAASGPLTSLLAHAPAARDQGPTESCVWHALSEAIYIRLGVQGEKRIFPSVMAGYSMTRRMQAPSGILTDTGCIPSEGVEVANSWGVCDETLFPFDPLQINNAPPWGVISIAASHKITAWKLIGSHGLQLVEDVKTALAAGYPVVFGTDIDQSYADYTSGVWNRVYNAPSIGKHMQCILGWESGAFTVLNSWGTSWGQSGYSLIGEPTIGGYYVSDVYCLDAAPAI